MPGNHYSFYAGISGEEIQGCDKGGGHGVCEGVVGFGAVEGDENDGCGRWRGGRDVGETYVGESEGGVGGWESRHYGGWLGSLKLGEALGTGSFELLRELDCMITNVLLSN